MKKQLLKNHNSFFRNHKVVSSAFIEENLPSTQVFVLIFIVRELPSNKCLFFRLPTNKKINIVIDVNVAPSKSSCLHHFCLLVQSFKEISLNSIFHFMSFQFQTFKFNLVSLTLSGKFIFFGWQRFFPSFTIQSLSFSLETFTVFIIKRMRSTKEILADNCLSIQLAEINSESFFFLFAEFL